MNLNQWIKHQFRKKIKIYIFPTQMGGYLIGLIFLMFLLAIGYSNNLLLIFTLFMFVLNLLWVLQTHHHLQSLKYSDFLISDGHADECLDISVFFKKSPDLPLNWIMTLETGDQDFPLDVLAQNKDHLSAQVTIKKRGHYKWRYLKIATELPFGLYRAWVYWPLNCSGHVYPKILDKFNHIKTNTSPFEGKINSGLKGEEDIWQLGPYSGEEFRKISWKHYAKMGELLIKEGEKLNNPIYRIKLNLPTDLSFKENYLSEIATEMVYCFRHQITFEFESIEKKYGPASSLKHLKECLKELSLC